MAKVPGDQCHAKVEKGLVSICAALVANPQPSELTKPSQRAFYNPAMSPQAAAVFGVPFGQHRHDAA